MILIIGSGGQLGKQMQTILSDKNMQFCAYDYPEIDITSIESVDKLIDRINPVAIVNCAAYTNVDKAEEDEHNAYLVNAMGPKNLAQVCNEKDIELIHISTDYVFSGEAAVKNGKRRPYIETDECKPQTAYGRTKLEGERLLAANHDKYYILRTAWLYGDGSNFVKTMLRLSGEHDTLRVVNDQFGSPTSTADLACAVCALLGSGKYGLYHATCEGMCSWFDFAVKIFSLAGKDIEIVPVSSEEFIRPAKRPGWSVLDNSKLKSIDKNVFRQWEEALKEYLDTMM